MGNAQWGLIGKIIVGEITWTSPHVAQGLMKIILPHMTSIEYNEHVIRFMLSSGHELTRLLLEIDPTLSISEWTFCYLFESIKTYNEFTQIFELLLEFKPQAINHQCLDAALKWYTGREPTDILQYLLEKTPKLPITQQSLFVAAGNRTHRLAFAQLLLKYNTSLKIPDRVILFSLGSQDMIRLLLDHDPVYQIPEYLVDEALR